MKGHGGRDTKAHVLKHNIEDEHVEVTQKDFKIIGNHFNNNILKGKIAEVLLIKQESSSSNVQDQSIELEFFS